MQVRGEIVFFFSNHGLEVTCQFKPLNRFSTLLSVIHTQSGSQEPSEKFSTGTRKSEGQMSLIIYPWGPSDILTLCAGARQAPQHVRLKTGKLINVFLGGKKNGDISHLRLSFGLFHQGNAA